METTSASDQKVALDTRGLEPPQPVLAILRKVGEMPRASTLEVRMDANPFQLYDLLQQRGFQLFVSPQKDGGFVAEIRSRPVAVH